MNQPQFPPDWTRAAFAPDPNPSFADLLRKVDPQLLPGSSGTATPPSTPHGTTILALRFEQGIVMAGDRRATEGMSIADRRMEKVYPADDYSAVAIAGVAAAAMDLVRLLQLELEHYEKLEGETLSLEGKANRLATLIKGNFPLAMQGIIVVPIFAGYDLRAGQGRIFRYDAIGGRYEDMDFHATGSGGTHARGTLKTRWREGLTRDDAVTIAVEALMNAADEDAATGGPDLRRGIFPVIAVVGAGGYQTVEDDELRGVTERLLAERGDR